MILTDLFEGRMKDIDIEYQDWLHSRGRGAIGDQEFQRAYGVTRREWAIRNSDWIMKKQARPQNPDAHLYPERQSYRPVKKETVHEIQDKVKYVLILDGKPVMVKTDLSKIERDAEFIRRHFPETQVDIKQVAEPNKAQLEENLRKWFKEKWVRFGPDGRIRGSCARGSESEGKPKCLPQAKAHALGKKKRAAAAAKKRREDPNPERRGPAKNVATKVRENDAVTEVTWPATALRTPRRKTPEPNIGEQGVAEGVELKFHTIELNESQIQPYVKKYFECYNIEKPYIKFVSNIKKFGSNKLIESNESQEINSFIQMINSVDSNKTIKVGDHFAVLAFEILFAWKEINASGFTTPKEVADIKMHNDGTINYIKFSDGDRYPRLTPATYQGKPIIQTAYFDNQSRAKSALTALVLKVPNGWEFNTADVEQGMAEGFLGDREYNRVMPFVKRIAGEVSDYDRDEFGEELWSLLDQRYGSKFAQSVLDDLDIYWDTYTELTGQQGVAEEQLDEKQDACYHKVKSRYKVWPSAYASGALVQCRKKGAANWGTGSKKK